MEPSIEHSNKSTNTLIKLTRSFELPYMDTMATECVISVHISVYLGYSLHRFV